MEKPCKKGLAAVFLFAFLTAFVSVYRARAAKQVLAAKKHTYRLSTSSVTVEQGGSIRLAVTTTSGGSVAARQATWSSNNRKTVKIDKKGQLTASTPGKAKVTAAVDGRKLSCTVKTVRAGNIQNIVWGTWKDKKGNQYKLSDGEAACRQLLKQIPGGYRLVKKEASLSINGTNIIHAYIKKGNQVSSMVLAKTDASPKKLNVYLVKGRHPDFSRLKQPKLRLLWVTQKKVPKTYVFLGDSRFEGMSSCNYNKKTDQYIAKDSQGLRWFQAQLKNARRYDSAFTVFIIGFGINDLYNAKRYADYTNRLHMKGAVYFCSVNPVDERLGARYGYLVTNRQIRSFNKVVQANAKHYKILDTYQALTRSGFCSSDGVHYTGDTYAKLYRYIKAKAVL